MRAGTVMNILVPWEPWLRLKVYGSFVPNVFNRMAALSERT
jgi:hypothetical protein